MLWFLRDKDKKKRRRRWTTDPGRSRDAKRPDTRDRSSRSRRSLLRRPRRSSAEDRRAERREDTRDRDDRRKAQSRDRTVTKEREEVFDAINFDGEPIEFDEVDHTFSRALTIALYSLLGLLVLSIIVYAFGRGVKSVSYTHLRAHET